MNARPPIRGAGDRPIRIALVGMGWAARSIWLPRLREHPQYVVTAVVDPVPDARTEALREIPNVQVFANIGQLPPGAIDLAVVAVPNYLHARIATDLLMAGIPVFLEKPVCLTSAEVEQLAAAERFGGATLLAGSAVRYRADVRALVRKARESGQIRHVDVRWVRARGVPQATGWFVRRDMAGGGAFLDLGWHLLDAVAMVLGPAEYSRVLGTVSNDFVNDTAARAAWRAEAADGIGAGDVEDTAYAFLVTDDGVSVALRASWASHETADVTTMRVDGSGGTTTLRCTLGFSPNRQSGSTLTFNRRGDSTLIPVPAESIGTEYVRQLDELPALLADPGSRGVAVSEAARSIRVIERVYESAQQIPA